jgi:hypothetical protein
MRMGPASPGVADGVADNVRERAEEMVRVCQDGEVFVDGDFDRMRRRGRFAIQHASHSGGDVDAG